MFGTSWSSSSAQMSRWAPARGTECWAGPGLAHLALFGLIQSDFQVPKRADRLGPRGTACPGQWARIWGLEVGLYQSSTQ